MDIEELPECSGFPPAREAKKKIYFGTSGCFWNPLEGVSEGSMGPRNNIKPATAKSRGFHRIQEGSKSRGWQAPSVEHRGFHWALEPSQIRPCGYVVELRRAQLAHWAHVHIETIENSYMYVQKTFSFWTLHYSFPLHFPPFFMNQIAFLQLHNKFFFCTLQLGQDYFASPVKTVEVFYCERFPSFVWRWDKGSRKKKVIFLMAVQLVPLLSAIRMM